jgi:hypothetical protein
MLLSSWFLHLSVGLDSCRYGRHGAGTSAACGVRGGIRVVMHR